MDKQQVINKLAAEFLRDYSERLGNDGCNDWEWPKWVPKSMHKELLPEHYVKDFGTKHPMNFIVVDRLAALLEQPK